MSTYLTQVFYISVILGTYNQNLQLFDATTFDHLRELMGHVGMVQTITASPSGRFLFSASVDKSIQVNKQFYLLSFIN